jgi:hypothetical protein
MRQIDDSQHTYSGASTPMREPCPMNSSTTERRSWLSTTRLCSHILIRGNNKRRAVCDEAEEVHDGEQQTELYPNEFAAEDGPGVCEERRHVGQVVRVVVQQLQTVDRRIISAL